MSNMKRFWVFMHGQYEAGGGLTDLVCSENTLVLAQQAAVTAVPDHMGSLVFAEILDTVSGEVYERTFLGDSGASWTTSTEYRSRGERTETPERYVMFLRDPALSGVRGIGAFGSPEAALAAYPGGECTLFDRETLDTFVYDDGAWTAIGRVSHAPAAVRTDGSGA